MNADPKDKPFPFGPPPPPPTPAIERKGDDGPVEYTREEAIAYQREQGKTPSEE